MNPLKSTSWLSENVNKEKGVSLSAKKTGAI